MARCLVIGANGFLGSGIADALAEVGHDVTAFDRFSRPLIVKTPGINVLKGDFLDPQSVSEAVAGHEYVFHFLSTTTPATADADPVRDVRENLAPSVHLLAACASSGVERVFFASTGGAIYGDQSQRAMTENVRPMPVSPYAIGKLAIEGYLAYFARKKKLDSTSFRISNPYGIRQLAASGHGVIPTFLTRVQAGLPLQVMGDGSSVRDFVHADDVVRMIVDTVGSETDHSVYNIGSGVGTSLTELLSVIAQVSGIQPTVEYLPEPPTFVHRSVLDTSRYRSEFGDHPLRSLYDGVAELWSRLARLQ